MWKLNCTLGQEEAVSRTAVISRINTTMVLVRFYGEKRRGGLAQGCQFPGNFHSSGIRGIGEWQFVIPLVSGWGNFGEFFCFRFEVNLNFF